MKEIWKSISGYEGLYEISSVGRVRNSKTGKLISPCYRNKYVNYVLTVKYSQKSFRAHRLVVSAFIKNDLAANEVVHHIDDDRFNNSVENLAVMTRGQVSATAGQFW